MSVDFQFDVEEGTSAQDVSAVKSYLKKFLIEYSKEMDFWEIMNVNLVRAVTKEFPGIISLQSTIGLAPDETLVFPRKSTVQYSRDLSALKESFGFTKLSYLICSETFDKLDLLVNFNIHSNPDRFDYPDYLWIDEAIEEFSRQKPFISSKWKFLKPELEAFLLEKFPTLTSMQVDITNAH